jgi:hypothetical protein
MRRAGPFLAIALILLLAAMALKPLLIDLPAPPPAAAAGRFVTGRAMARLQRILGDERPHPVDSAANDAVRERLLAELRGIGLSPVVTDELGCNGVPRSRTVGCARVRNVRATIGPQRGRHLLIASHYDSSPVGPGAADDGIGVAVMLEVAALLKRSELKRPVTFLFDEGEELQLNGARAFLRSDPLAAQVDQAINLEARGVTGPAIMFETSRPNGGALDWFGRARWRPVANSLTADLYALMPNDTDVSVFKGRGWTILNFALIGNETRYHSPSDRIAALDPRSLDHMGVQVLRAAEAAAAAGPATRSRDNRLYANTIGGAFVSLPAPAGIVMLVLLMLTAAALAWQRSAAIARSAATMVAALAVAGGGVAILAAGIAFARPGAFWRAHPGLIAAAIDLVALAAAAGAVAAVGRPCPRGTLRAAFWLLFLLAGAGLCLVTPGAAIFFLLPPLLAIAGILAGRAWPPAEAVGAVAAWLALFLSWAPLLHLSETLLDFGAAWLFATIAALILLPAAIELKPLLDEVPPRRLAGALALACGAAWVALLFFPAYSHDRKQDFSLFHVEGRGGARWMVLNDGAALPDGYDGFRAGVEVPWSRRRHWAATAPSLALAAAGVERLGTARHPDGRWIRLRLRMAGHDSLLLRTEPGHRLVAVRLGRALTRFGRGRPGDPFYLRCSGRSCDGASLDLLVAGGRPVPATLVGFRYALPAAARPLLAARPARAAPHYIPDASITVTELEL